MQEKYISLFAIKRSLNYLSKFFLEILERLKTENENNIQKISKSLEEISKKSGENFDLSFLVKHMDFLDEKKFSLLRKEILDRSNELHRSILREFE